MSVATVDTEQDTTAALTRWLEDRLPGFRGPIRLEKFAGGQSNPTFALTTPTKSYVLRRRPAGALLQSAHAVEREFIAIEALGAAGFPVPQAYALCLDDSVIGSIFYVMERVDGRVFWDARLPEQTPAQRAQIYAQQIDVLAQLHNVDPQKAGLSNFGASGNYFARQINRWTKQYRASGAPEIPEMERLIEWLPATVPQDDVTCVVHGDYRLDNIIFKPDREEVAAVLDWELSTLGHPLADFSYFLMAWSMPEGERTALAGCDLAAMGIPSLEDAIARYNASAHHKAPQELNWHFAYNYFRLAAILQGIVGRIASGTANNTNASRQEARIRPLARKAIEFARRAGLDG